MSSNKLIGTGGVPAIWIKLDWIDTRYDNACLIKSNEKRIGGVIHINLKSVGWLKPETDNNQIYVYSCVSCVYSIKRYGILSVPLHLFYDEANCHIVNNHVEPW